MLSSACLLGGVCLHTLVLRHGEWDLSVHKLLGAAAAAPFALAVCLAGTSSRHAGAAAALETSLCAVLATLAGVFASMLVYRVALHRLQRFPGPFAARISNLYYTVLAARTGRGYVELERLHGKHGDVVRIGSRTLSITHPQALQAIYGTGTRCIKAPWYDSLSPETSMQCERDPRRHAYRRRVWEKGFNTKALRNYEPRVALYTDKLLAYIDSSRHEPVDAALCFNMFAFDVMGDLSWGQSFGMLDRGERHWVIDTLRGFMMILGKMAHLPWLFRILASLPVTSDEVRRFEAWIAEQLQRRMRARAFQNPPEVPNVFSYLLDEYHSQAQPTKQDTVNLQADGLTITVAGSETTSLTLTCLFMELAEHPRASALLQQELDAALQQEEQAAKPATALARLQYLEACINEALRLYPAVPSGLARVTPAEGVKLSDDVYIPGDVLVQVPTYVLHRDARFFVRPNDFIPERWTTSPELVLDASVFSPFSIGSYNCVGKQLAMMELRNVTSQILRRYHVSLAPGQTKERFVDGLVDCFTFQCPKLDLVFVPR